MYTDSDLDFKENKTLYYNMELLLYCGVFLFLFLVKRIMYILLAKKRKIDIQCVCVLHSVAIF